MFELMHFRTNDDDATFTVTRSICLEYNLIVVYFSHFLLLSNGRCILIYCNRFIESTGVNLFLSYVYYNCYFDKVRLRLIQIIDFS